MTEPLAAQAAQPVVDLISLAMGSGGLGVTGLGGYILARKMGWITRPMSHEQAQLLIQAQRRIIQLLEKIKDNTEA
jgi:hypothetical protein